ncbi:hypothetical protein FOCC_FOCC002373 [Frankliniella occidentalis]|uniref:Transmembrane protein 203-like n=1 Tax=Frankliniella occidentalis TaxID=133901 RepID=A0A9C6U156_FRAOC|nr:transmembrane protein 203-like [Frankliniella occidentalis]KAE8750944.1 hypothetical protein FOCC_FOCC002373 [Frankliniella occidentalis]
MSCSAYFLKYLLESDMFFSWKEIVAVLGMTLFEVWVHVTSVVVFLTLVTLQLDGVIDQSWWTIFVPLFVADAMNAYFAMIVAIRLHLNETNPIKRSAWSFVALALLFSFKVMLCKKLSGSQTLDYSEIMSPIFIFLQLVVVRTRTHLCPPTMA